MISTLITYVSTEELVVCIKLSGGSTQRAYLYVFLRSKLMGPSHSRPHVWNIKQKGKCLGNHYAFVRMTLSPSSATVFRDGPASVPTLPTSAHYCEHSKFGLNLVWVHLYLFIGGTNFRYGENSQVVSSRWGEKSITSSNVIVVSKYATFRKSLKNYYGAQQITSRHNQNSNKSQLVTSRYGFPVCRKLRRNWLCVSISQNGAQLYFTQQTPEYSRPQPFCAN